MVGAGHLKVFLTWFANRVPRKRSNDNVNSSINYTLAYQKKSLQELTNFKPLTTYLVFHIVSIAQKSLTIKQ